MTGEPNRALLSQLHRLFHDGTVSGLAEGQLLEQFVAHRDETAFRALVSRHGPMVLAVCRRMLRDPRDVEDAFQATFLILVRKAAEIRRRELLGNWLYGVAYRVAARSRAISARNQVRETIGLALETTEVGAASEWHDLLPFLDEELSRLPERFRLPIILCHLEGHTHDEAAERLRCPVGTVRSRLARGRERLRARLIRRGAAPAWLAAASQTSQGAEWLVPPALVESTVAAAVRFSAAKSLAGAIVSTTAISLTQGVLRTMLLTKLKLFGVGAVSAGLVAVAMAAPLSGRLKAQAGSTPSATVVATGTAAPPERSAQARTTNPATTLADSQLEGAWKVVKVEPLQEDGVPVSWRFHGRGLEQIVLTPHGRRTVMAAYKASPGRGKNFVPIEIQSFERSGRDLKALSEEGVYLVEGDQLTVILNPNDDRARVQMSLQRDGKERSVARRKAELSPVQTIEAMRSLRGSVVRSIDLPQLDEILKGQEPPGAATDPDKDDARKLLTIARRLGQAGKFDEAQAVVEIVRDMKLHWGSLEDAPENVSSAIQIERSMARQRASAQPAAVTPPPAPARSEKPAEPRRQLLEEKATDSRVIHEPAPTGLARVRGLERRLKAASAFLRERTRLVQQGEISLEAVQKSREDVNSLLEEIDDRAEQATDEVESLEIELDGKKAALREAEAKIKEGDGLIAVYSMRAARAAEDRLDPRLEVHKQKFEKPVLEAQRDGKQAEVGACELRIARAKRLKAALAQLKARVAAEEPGAVDTR